MSANNRNHQACIWSMALMLAGIMSCFAVGFVVPYLYEQPHAQAELVVASAVMLSVAAGYAATLLLSGADR